MNKLNQDDLKELDLLIKEAQNHVFNDIFHWIGAEFDNSYFVWITRAKALIGMALPIDSPDLIRINERQKPGCQDLEFPDYARMLLGIKQYIKDHQG